MRWERLFSDLEAQAEALQRAEVEAEVADRTRHEFARIHLVDRLRAQVGTGVHLRVVGGGILRGELLQVGADWLLVDAATESVVRLDAVAAVYDLPSTSVHPDAVGVVAGRLRLTSVLRGLARDRCAVRVGLTDGTTTTGTPDRVGADAVDLACHEPGERPGRARVTLTYGSVGSLSRVETGW